MKNLWANCLMVVICTMGLALFQVQNACAQAVEDELVLSEIKVNNKLSFNTEILQIDSKLYVPIKQIAEVVEEEINFDRANKSISFDSRSDSQVVKLSGINKTIEIGDSKLDKNKYQIFWIQQGFVLQDDLLVEKELVERFLDVEIQFDELNYVVNVQVNRPLKALKQERFYSESPEETIIKPVKQKLNIRSVQVNVSSLGNVVSNNEGTVPFTFGNQLNMSLVGDAYGGTYRVGPTFVLRNTGEFGLSGFQQSWSKQVRDELGVILGDSSVQVDPLNFPSASVLGLRVGHPQKLNLKFFDGLEFEGECEPRTEVLLQYNEQVIARQVCKTGTYKFTNIPKLVGTNNSYKVVQNNTDGTQNTLREDTVPFYDGLIQSKEKRWEVFAGRPSFTNNIFLAGEDGENGLFSRNQVNKVLGGGYFKYGLSPRVNIQGAVTADKNISNPTNFDEQFGSLTNKPLFSDVRFIEGQTASVGLNVRPKSNFGVNLYGAISNSSDQSPTSIFRAGQGTALMGSYDFRHKNFYNQGSFYSYSPSFYTPMNAFSNRRGANMSFGLNLKRQSYGLNLRLEQTNLDGESFGGVQTNKNILLTHNAALSKTTYISSFLNLNETQSDAIDNSVTVGRTNVRQRVNKWVDLTLSGGFNNFEDNLNAQKTEIYDLTPGLSFRLGKNQQHQLSMGASFFSNDNASQYIQGRFKFKENFVYQPSITRSSLSTGDLNWLISNGLFWEKDSGIRFGAEHLWSIAVPKVGEKISAHSLRLSALFNLGFADKKPYLMSTPESGYLKGYVFVDLNKNGVRDNGELPIDMAKLILKDKDLEVDSNGSILIKDIPSGKYEMYLDPLSLPIALVPIDQSLKFEIEPGRLTELNFTAQLSGGAVNGRISIETVNGKRVSAENIVVIAVNEEGKEVSYTYANRRGFYTISELPPGKYTIKIDQLDIDKRNLTLQEVERTIEIPLVLDELIEVDDVDFLATQSVF